MATEAGASVITPAGRGAVLSLRPKQGTGGEIGVWRGDFSQAILTAARPRKLHLIDPWQIRHDPTHARA